MKKSLIALAALAATASFAQSSVQLDGIMDAGYQARDYKGTKVTGIAGNGSSTSQLNIRGTEDLGGGLKAEFRVETDWNTVSNNANTGVASSISTTPGGSATAPVGEANSKNSAAGTFGNGEIRVGVAGGFGRVDLGAVNYNTLGTYLTGQPFGTAIGSGFRGIFINDTQATSQVRAENAIKYVSPTFNGFNASLYWSGKQTKANTVAATATSNTGLNTQQSMFSTSLGAYDQQGTTEVGVNYTNGPIAASYSSLKNDYVGVYNGNAATQTNLAYTQTVNTAAAAYTMGAAKFSVLNQTNKKSDNTTNNTATTVSASYALGATTLMAQVGELKNVSGVKSKLVGLGADYALSKRTAAYVRYESIDDKANVIAAAPTVDVTATGKRVLTAVGLRHSF